MNNGGGSVTCVPCPSGFIQSLDGFSCVSCENSCKNCNSGAIQNSFLTDYELDGNYLTDSNGFHVRKCVTCDPKNSVLNGGKCTSCRPLLFTQSNLVNITSIECNQVNAITLGGLIFIEKDFANEPNNFNFMFDSNVDVSWYLNEYLRASYRTCKISNRRNITACQNLANMCVLNMYTNPPNVQNQLVISIDACAAYDEIYLKQNQSDQIRVPTIKYSNTYEKYKQEYLNEGINSEYISIKFDNNCQANQLQLYAAEYELNGKFINLGKLDLSRLQLCNLIPTSNSKIANVLPFSTTNLEQVCSVKIESLFDFFDSKSTIFFDLFLKYDDGPNLYPIPFAIVKDGSQDIDDSSIDINRRFFLADIVSSKKEYNSTSSFIRYAKSITLRFDLMKDKTDGEIYPPIFLIEYAYAKREDSNKTVDISFKIEYKMNVDAQLLYMFVIVGTIGGLSLIWSCLRIWNWNRRSGRFALDLIYLFKFIMFLSGSVSNAFFIAVVSLSIYWLLFYRGQNLAYVFLPLANQENIFSLFIIIGFVLKLLDVLYLIFVQSSYDIFFIDWERPKVDAKSELAGYNRLPPISSTKAKQNNETKLDANSTTKSNQIDSKELATQNKVSCWRTLFVANEWNELQTFRKINPTIQLIFILFLLKVINLEALTLRDCNNSIENRDPNEYQAAYSKVLRVAICASMYLGLGK